MLTLSDKTFQKHLDADIPLFVMFHAEFSGPCRLAMPEFQEAHGRSGNRVRFATFDLDENPNTPERYNIRGVPEFILFVNGKPCNPTVGSLNCKEILSLLEMEDQT